MKAPVIAAPSWADWGDDRGASTYFCGLAFRKQTHR